MTKLRKIIDSVDDFRYSKHKLIRFTGFRFKKIVECGDFIKNKKRIKTKQCAPGWARISEKSTPSGVFFCNEPQENVLEQQKQVTNYQSPPGSRSPIIPQNMK